MTDTQTAAKGLTKQTVGGNANLGRDPQFDVGPC
jgi:hypothetical protein